MRKNNSSKTQPKPKAKSSTAKTSSPPPANIKSAGPSGSDESGGANKTTTKKIGAAEFFRLTRAEIGRITWPTRKETTMTTVMVVVMVAILSLFFFLVDQILSYGIKVLLG